MLRGQQIILVYVLLLTYTPGEYSERLRSDLDMLGKLKYVCSLGAKGRWSILGLCSVAHIKPGQYSGRLRSGLNALGQWSILEGCSVTQFQSGQ
jgi:hypothetical protein